MGSLVCLGENSGRGVLSPCSESTTDFMDVQEQEAEPVGSQLNAFPGTWWKLIKYIYHHMN